MPEPTDINARVAEGIRLFNAGDYFEAHEAWEDAWHASAGRTKATLQVLIQLAVALEHEKRGNRVGAGRMLERAGRRWEALGDARVEGLPDAGRLLEAARAYLAGDGPTPAIHGRGI